MKITKNNFISFLVGIMTGVCVLFLLTDTLVKSASQVSMALLSPNSVGNRNFMGGIPIASEIGENAKCVNGIDFQGTAFVFGMTDRRGWLLVSFMGRAAGWIPASTVEFNHDKYRLPVVALEPEVSYIPSKNDQYIEAIRDITENPEIKPFFVCFSHVPEAPKHRAAVYVDKSGGTYFVSLDTSQVVDFANGYEYITNIENASKPIDYEELEEFARNYLFEKSLKFKEHYSDMHINFHGKGGGYFPYAYVYTGYLYEPIDGLPQMEVEITFLPGGTIIGYTNTLDFIGDE